MDNAFMSVPYLPLCRERMLHVPNVKIRSSQQLSLSTLVFHVSPVLSCAVAEVPLVMTLSGRDCASDSVGGCSILSVGGAVALCIVVCMQQGSGSDGRRSLIAG